MLYIFEDDEAAIKLIIKGRSRTKRHVSRTHRVALDWLFDRINLDHKIQIMFVDTKHQLADILTQGNFTRDECNNLLHLLNISHCRFLCCAQKFSLTSCTKTIANRMQEQKEESRIVVKSEPTMNLVSRVSTSSATVQSPIASKRPEALKPPCRTDWTSIGKLDARDRNNDAASSSQGWQIDALLDVSTEKLVATEDQERLNYLEDSISKKETCRSSKSGKNSTNAGTEGNDKDWSFSKFQQGMCCTWRSSQSRDKDMVSVWEIKWKNLDVNPAIWRIFIFVTLHASVHLGQDYTENLRSTENQPKKSLRQLMVSDQTEITGLTTIDWQQRMWRETTLLTDRADQFATEKKTFVFSDSVLFLGGKFSTRSRRQWFHK